MYYIIGFYVQHDFFPLPLNINSLFKSSYGLQDIASKIMAFSQQGPRTVCILSANGAICNVTLRQPAMSGGTVTYEVYFVSLYIYLIFFRYLVITFDEFMLLRHECNMEFIFLCTNVVKVQVHNE